MSDPKRPDDLGKEIEREVRMTLDEVATALQDAAHNVTSSLKNDENLRRTVQEIGSAARSGLDAVRRGVWEMQQSAPGAEKEPRQKRKKRKKRVDYGKKARAALSNVGWQAFVGFLMGAVTHANFIEEGGMEAGTLILGLLCASFLVSAFFSFVSWRKLRRIVSYQNVLGERPFCTVREIAEMTEKSEGAVRRDLRRLILSGDFADVYLAPDASRLFSNETAYRLYLAHAAERRAPAPAPEPAPAAQEEAEPAAEPDTLEQTRAFLRDVREAQRHISDAGVLEETHRIEAYTQSILTWLEKHPEDAGQIRRFVSYYMPTTLKLLTTYNEVSPQAHSSSVAEEIQTNICGILHTVGTAFQNLQNNLLKDTALDVSAEISALETVLAQDGLTKDSLFLKE